MPTGASQVFVEQVREADAILNSQPSSGADQIFVERYRSALQVLNDETDASQIDQIFVEKVRQAVAILGITIGFDNQLTSVDLDGTTEFLANLTDNPLGIANAWTVSTVFKFDVFAIGTEVIQVASSITGDNFSNITLRTAGTQGFEVILSDATGTPSGDFLKQWRWANTGISAIWGNVAVKWDGVDIFLVINGVDQGTASTKVIDDAIVLADNDRKVFLWASRASSPGIEGNLLYAALWNKVLDDAELLEAWNGGVAGSFNLGADSGNYVSAANLQHWWRTCADPLDIGKDSGIASTLIDVLTDAVDITAADCVADVPA